MTWWVARQAVACGKRCTARGTGWRSFGRQPLRTRKAMLPDAAAIHGLICQYSGDGTLLPRSFSDVCENIRDFFVAQNSRKQIVGCGALHIYGPHLCEVRSIAVAPSSRSRGAGSAVVRALIKEARRHDIDSICLFTRI